MGEAMHIWGLGANGKSVYLSVNFAVNLNFSKKHKLFKKGMEADLEITFKILTTYAL